MGKKKDVLVIASVFGNEYKGYIPVYLYSLYKNYPEYDAIIYIDRPLTERLKHMVSMIQEMNPGKYRIEQINQNINNVGEQYKKAYRWLCFEPFYLQYKYAYIGDIDIYLCSESTKLHEQHINHMKAQKTIYSNVIRRYVVPNSIVAKQELLKKIGIYDITIGLHKSICHKKKLSGLHFVKVDPYYKKTRAMREKYIKLYSKPAIEWLEGSLQNKVSNEEVLYQIVKKSDLRLPKQVQEGEEIISCKDETSHAFRPFHGIHFGMWRGGKVEDKYKEYLKSELSISYFEQLMNDYESDEMLKYIIDNNVKLVKKTILGSLDYYKKELKNK